MGRWERGCPIPATPRIQGGDEESHLGAAKTPQALAMLVGVIPSPQLSTGRNSLRQKLLCQGCGADWDQPGTSHFEHTALMERLQNPQIPEIVTFHSCSIDDFL